MKLVVTLRSGAQIKVDVERFEVSRHRVSNTLAELKWVSPGTWQSKLHYVDLEQVVCVHAERESPAGGEEGQRA